MRNSKEGKKEKEKQIIKKRRVNEKMMKMIIAHHLLSLSLSLCLSFSLFLFAFFTSLLFSSLPFLTS